MASHAAPQLAVRVTAAAVQAGGAGGAGGGPLCWEVVGAGCFADAEAAVSLGCVSCGRVSRGRGTGRGDLQCRLRRSVPGDLGCEGRSEPGRDLELDEGGLKPVEVP